MKNNDLIRIMAERNEVPAAAAADQLDSVISKILRRLRRGGSFSLPGLGTFEPGRGSEVKFRPGKAVRKG